MKKGFTLIELLIYISLVTIVIGGIILFAGDLLYGRVKSTTQQEVAANMRFASKRLLFEIRNASAINWIQSDDLCLSTREITYNPTRLHVYNGRLRIGWGGGSSDCSALIHTQFLTSNLVTVTNLKFTNLSTPKTKNVQFSISISHNNPSGRKEWQLNQTSTSSAELRAVNSPTPTPTEGDDD